MKHILYLLFLLTINVTGQENWLIDKNGCKVYNPHPRKNESVEWTGGCEDGIATGYGQLIWYLREKKTNNVYTGNMVNGRPEGSGEYVTDLNFVKSIYTGEFRNGDIIKGQILKCYKKDTILYKGEIKDWEANGEGIMYMSDKEWFTGEFSDGYYINGIFTSKLYGYVIQSDDWKYYSAQSGTLTWNDGIKYIGELKNTIPNGKGTITYPDGTSEYGIWKNGELTRRINNGM